MRRQVRSRSLACSLAAFAATAAFALCAGLVGCSRPSTDNQAPAGSSVGATTAPGVSAPGAEPGTSALAPAAPAPSASARPPLELLRFSFTSEVKGKEPVDKLEAGEAGERVYAHLTLRNRGAERRTLKLQFRVNGDKRTMLELKVDHSWSYRTWGFNTLRPGDKGELTVQATDDEGNLIVDEKLPIRAGGGKGAAGSKGAAGGKPPAKGAPPRPHG
jgi:hypothetical protein